MALTDFLEDFWLYKRRLSNSVNGGIKVNWDKTGVLQGGLSRSRQTEIGVDGRRNSGAATELSEKYTLNVLGSEISGKLAYDDFVKRVKDGAEFRVISNHLGRISPECSAIDLSICEVERSRMPKDGDRDA